MSARGKQDECPHSERHAQTAAILRQQVEAEHARNRLLREEKEEKGKNFYHREIGRRAFFRRLPMPTDAGPQGVDAKMEDGCLFVAIHKRPGAVVRKRIPIR